MSLTWLHSTRIRLLELHVENAGWPYAPGKTVFAESSAVAALGLLATARGDSIEPEIRSAADWLADIQQADGRVGLCRQVTNPGWPTPYAVLLWAALDGYQTERRKAIDWLYQRSGVTCDRDRAIGHDTTIAGWPWVDGTHSWLEPTALAILAIRCENGGGHVRTDDGIRMICDRMTPTGGWNYGNPSVFGKALVAQPAPSGLALLALKTIQVPPQQAQQGCRFLQRTLPRIRSPRSLCWGLLGLQAWDQRPADADAWLSETATRLDRENASTMDLALMLLASSGRSLKLLYAEPWTRQSSASLRSLRSSPRIHASLRF
jgi:hypothetical protein